MKNLNTLKAITFSLFISFGTAVTGQTISNDHSAFVKCRTIISVTQTQQDRFCCLQAIQTK